MPLTSRRPHNETDGGKLRCENREGEGRFVCVFAINFHVITWHLGQIWRKYQLIHAIKNQRACLWPRTVLVPLVQY